MTELIFQSFVGAPAIIVGPVIRFVNLGDRDGLCERFFFIFDKVMKKCNGSPFTMEVDNRISTACSMCVAGRKNIFCGNHNHNEGRFFTQNPVDWQSIADYTTQNFDKWMREYNMIKVLEK